MDIRSRIHPRLKRVLLESLTRGAAASVALHLTHFFFATTLPFWVQHTAYFARVDACQVKHRGCQVHHYSATHRSMLAVPTGRGGDGPADSWLGGRPRYLDGRERPAPTCGACAAPLPLVAQISAPVDGRARALHVFGCPPCAGDARAWCVRRTQAAAVDALSVEALSIEPAAATAAPAPAADAWTWDDDADDDEADLEALLRSHEAGAAAPPAPRRPAPPPAPPLPPEREREPAAAGPVLPRVALDWVAEPEVAAVDSDDDGDDAAAGDDAAMRRRLAAYLAEGDDAAALRAAHDGARRRARPPTATATSRRRGRQVRAPPRAVPGPGRPLRLRRGAALARGRRAAGRAAVRVRRAARLRAAADADARVRAQARRARRPHRPRLLVPRELRRVRRRGGGRAGRAEPPGFVLLVCVMLSRLLHGVSLRSAYIGYGTTTDAPKT